MSQSKEAINIKNNESHISNTDQNKANIFQRYKWYILTIIGLLLIILVILLVVFLVIIPKRNNIPTSSPINNKPNQQGLYEQPNLDKIPNNLGLFDDNTQCNEYTPKLNEKFDYNKLKIRGVNLGGWLVPEPFIVPSLYEDQIDQGVVDEWTLCEVLGKVGCTKRLIKHYDSFLQESDIQQIQQAGLNHVRIPIGYWMFDIQENEPFIYGSWDYLLRGLEWCRKYGLRVMLDFHAAPGSQNGWNHSGRLGDIRFLNPNNTQESNNYVQRFEMILKKAKTYFDRDEYKNLVTQIGVLNEPAAYKTNQKITLDFYKESYQQLRSNESNNTNSTSKLLVYHEGFLGLDKWAGTMPSPPFENIAIDSHNYIIFDNQLIAKPLTEMAQFPCDAWAQDFTKSMQNFGFTMCGEFSVASNDCGKWLNGIGLGARYDGTYLTNSPLCPQCSCKGKDDYKKFSNEYKQFLQKFALNQMDAFEKGIGWYFWNFKTENHINPHWDYFLGLEQGWLPKDVNQRTKGCVN